MPHLSQQMMVFFAKLVPQKAKKTAVPCFSGKTSESKCGATGRGTTVTVCNLGCSKTPLGDALRPTDVSLGQEVAGLLLQTGATEEDLSVCPPTGGETQLTWKMQPIRL